MKRLIIISLIVALFNTGYLSNSYAFGGFGSILKNLFRGSKNIVDDVGKTITKPADEIKTLGSKTPEEIVGAKNVEQSGHTISSAVKEEQLLSIVGKERHSADFLAVKKNDRGSFRKLKHIDDLQLDNIAEWVLESKGEKSSNKYSFYKYIIINWIGKVYRNSVYYNKPVLSYGKHQIINYLPTVRYVSSFLETRTAINELLLLNKDSSDFTKSKAVLHNALMSCSFSLPKLAENEKSDFLVEEIGTILTDRLYSQYIKFFLEAK